MSINNQLHYTEPKVTPIGLPMYITPAQIEVNTKRFFSLLAKVDLPGIDDLVEHLAAESDIVTAPASTKPGFHGAYIGGLMEHLLNVYDELVHKIERFGLDLTEQDAILAGLLHDMVKVDLYQINWVKNKAKPDKLPTKGKNVMTRAEYDAMPDKVPSDAKPYVRVMDYIIGHGEESVYHIMQYMVIPKKVASMINWHMGAFDPRWDQYGQGDKAQDLCPELVALHTADWEASRYVDGQATNNTS